MYQISFQLPYFIISQKTQNRLSLHYHILVPGIKGVKRL